MQRTSKFLAVLVAVLAAGAVAALAIGCGSDGSSSTSADTTDAAFINDMIPHHQGAIDMAVIAQTRAQHPQIRTLAKNIIAAQQAEIADMKTMRSSMDHMDGMGSGDHMGMSQDDMGMGGDMSSLRNGRPFDRAFIDQMIPHHQGAIRMARRELADGKDGDLKTMANAIIRAQTAEIAQMRAWRARWYGSASSKSGASGSSMGGNSTMHGH
jgi:uncharacterized protein (DUF305 family)